MIRSLITSSLRSRPFTLIVHGMTGFGTSRSKNTKRFLRVLCVLGGSYFAFVSDFDIRISSFQEDFRFLSASGFLGALLAILLGGLPASASSAGASPCALATLCFRASIRLMTWASSGAGGVTISWPATLASISLVSFSVYTSLYLEKSNVLGV